MLHLYSENANLPRYPGHHFELYQIGSITPSRRLLVIALRIRAYLHPYPAGRAVMGRTISAVAATNV